MFLIALLAVTFSGFIALSYEVLWFRVFSFVTGGTAPSFGVVLSAFLLGIAFGSLWSRRLCRDDDSTGERHRLQAPAWLMAISSVGGFLLPAFVAFLVVRTTYTLALPLVVLVAALNGAVLPLVAHFGVPPDHRAGERLSYLYLANIVGSSAGSLLTGFVLLDHLSLPDVSLALLAIGLVLSAALFAVARLPRRRLLAALAVCGVMAAGSAVAKDGVYASFYERLLLKEDYSGQVFSDTVETRSGVINVTTDGEVYGGGVYDGVFNTSLVHDDNMIVRAYSLGAVHPAPRDVLVIGLSSGSWAQVIAHMPGVEHVTIIEINPGYLDLIATRPEVESLLTNPAVDIVIDDGRRWLVANPDRTFDAVVMNTTWHWRGHATNLLSVEFMDLIGRHLNPGGVLGYNTTGSHNAQKTGCAAFEHGFRMLNFMWLSDRPITLVHDRWRRSLTRFHIDGQRVFDPQDPEHARRLEEVLSINQPGGPRTDDYWYLSCEELRPRFALRPVITDDNMATEWYRPWYYAY